MGTDRTYQCFLVPYSGSRPDRPRARKKGTGSRPFIPRQMPRKTSWAGCLSPFSVRNASVNRCRIVGQISMKFENQVFSERDCPSPRCLKESGACFDRDRNVLLRDLELVNCEFIGEGLVSYGGPFNRSTAENLRLKHCAVNSFFGLGAVFDDVVVDGLRVSRSPVILNGCALRHVVLAGKCGRFLFNRDVCHDDQKRNSAFADANAEFYKVVDWALDITSLDTSGFEIRGTIPAGLVRRDPDVHFIMTRSTALEGVWKNYEPFDSFQISVSIFLHSGAEDDLFVVPKQSKNFKERLAFFRRLKSVGLVIRLLKITFVVWRSRPRWMMMGRPRRYSPCMSSRI